uniref:Uncharacterized protein n=1 Tax=Lepeophtheirus salmonis TaxID=72036 RepID=A0A0K2U9Z8_LEPSM
MEDRFLSFHYTIICTFIHICQVTIHK